MRRPVGCTELLRPQAGQRLHLVAASEERQFGRVGRANITQTLGQHVEGFIPLDFDKLTVAALGARLAQQRLAQFGSRILLHDAGRALGTQHALIGRVIAVTLDKTDFIVFQRHLDAAAAGAHITGGKFDFLLVVIFYFDDSVH